MDEKTVARFWAKVDKVNGPVHPLHGQCWVWTAATQRGGYGGFFNGKKWSAAHRVSLAFSGVAVSDGHHVLHRCDNPPCVNPAHLFLGTHADNMRDMCQKGRHGERYNLGSANAKAKLAESQVAEIRVSSARSAVLAEKFGVHRSTIHRIRTGRDWAHIPLPTPR